MGLKSMTHNQYLKTSKTKRKPISHNPYWDFVVSLHITHILVVKSTYDFHKNFKANNRLSAVNYTKKNSINIANYA